MDQWPALPVDLLKTIEELLTSYPDKVRLCSVCASWQSSLPKLPNHKLCQLPWLLLPNDPNGETSFGFFDPVEKRVYNIELPEVRGKLFRGSSHGWVVTVEKSPAIYLVNPLTRVQVQLPPRSRFPDVVKYRADKPGKEYAIRNPFDSNFHTLSATPVRNHLTDKIVLSSAPTSRDFVAVAIYGDFGELAYCKYGDKKWTFLHKGHGACSDVIFHKGQFYAVSFSEQLVVFDIGSCIKVTEIVPRSTGHYKLYLVESGGELMMVEREVPPHARDDPNRRFRYKTCDFKIYKLDTSSSRWCRVKNLGDDFLFLGWNSSLAISSCDFPGYKGNHIYFTDDNMDFHREGVEGGHDIGVFNVDDRLVEPLLGYTCDSHLVWPAPVWVMPNPYT